MAGFGPCVEYQFARRIKDTLDDEDAVRMG
jgi:hypothetical protein